MRPMRTDKLLLPVITNHKAMFQKGSREVSLPFFPSCNLADVPEICASTLDDARKREWIHPPCHASKNGTP